MKKFILTLILLFISISIFASNWKEVQTREIPNGTPVYVIQTDSGKPKYCIYINNYGVNVSETNAKEFIAGRRRLELVKWYDSEKDAFRYTIRQLKNININLDHITW